MSATIRDVSLNLKGSIKMIAENIYYQTHIMQVF